MNDRTIAVVGLGYVGLPVAVEMARRYKTIGFDIQEARVAELKTGYDRNHEEPAEGLKQPSLMLTSHLEDLKAANFFIIAVPTPIDDTHQPDLKPILSASQTVGKVLKKGDIVVYESTVYPGLTEEDCAPVLERFSGLKSGVDFKLGYSPERINPGDHAHRFTTIQKIVSGQDEATLNEIAEIYGSVVTAGVYKASSIKVAEAAKVIENTQRDLNIALMNELAIIFDRMGISSREVLEAAGTKWNFIKFTPGLVGGHCIGVDPYYLTHKAEKENYIPQVILAGRRINDEMGKYIAQKTIREMIHSGHSILGSRVTILGLTFKENCKDIRNTRVVDIIRELEDYGVQVQVCDPMAHADEALREYGVKLVPLSDVPAAEAIVVAVGHQEFKAFGPEQFSKMSKKNPVLIDVKGLFQKAPFVKAGFRFWQL